MEKIGKAARRGAPPWEVYFFLPEEAARPLLFGALLLRPSPDRLPVFEGLLSG